MWAEKTLPGNPWQMMLKQVKPMPKQKVKPFTAEEVKRILEGLRMFTEISQTLVFIEFDVCVTTLKLHCKHASSLPNDLRLALRIVGRHLLESNPSTESIQSNFLNSF